MEKIFVGHFMGGILAPANPPPNVPAVVDLVCLFVTVCRLTIAMSTRSVTAVEVGGGFRCLLMRTDATLRRTSVRLSEDSSVVSIAASCSSPVCY